MPVDLKAEFQGCYTAKRTSTKYITVHHAAALYPQGSAIEDIRAVHRYHLSKGWCGIGYHRVLAETGGSNSPIGDFWVSDPNLQRAHIAYRNHECIGISMLTNIDSHPSALPGSKWLAALIDAVADLKRMYPNAKIEGHRDLALPGYGTSCPGKRWYDWKGELLAEVDQALGNGTKLWRPYITTRNNVAVRTGPGRNYGIAWDGKCLLPADFEFDGAAVKGQEVAGSSLWIHMRSGDGFLHAKGQVEVR